MRLGARDLRFDIATDSPTIAVVGPSGSGKSTLLRVVAGVEARAQGTVSFAGEPWLEKTGVRVPPWSRPVGWVPQDSLLFPDRSVLDNLLFGAPRTVNSEGAVAEIAALLRIEQLFERMPSRLSGGERQRVALGRALLARPKLLLLDEPFSALDRPLREEIRGIVADWIRSSRAASILVSHDEEDACFLAEETYTLAGGGLTLIDPRHAYRSQA